MTRTTTRSVILAAVKTVEPDAKRALAITDHLASEFRRHPRDWSMYLYPLAEPPRLLPDNAIETMIAGALRIKLVSSRSNFRVEAQRVEPRPEAREAARYYADRGWWLPGWN